MDALNATTVLTLTQALQLVGLVPSLFVVVFLLTLTRSNKQAIIPIFYFLALACGFALPLLEIYPSAEHNVWLHGGLLVGESLLVAFGFLLICQFLMGEVPDWRYWLVLAIPLLGGSMILYAHLLSLSESCKFEDCPDTNSVKTLYHIFSSAMMFLLLIVYSSRISTIQRDDRERKHKYWLIVSLILLHLLVLVVDLARLAGRINLADASLIDVLLRLSFIYLVITSLFRVFYPSLAKEVLVVAGVQTYNPSVDLPHVARIKAMLENDKVYREMRLNRAALAEKLGLHEYHLSRIINYHFGKSFNELINSYRIEEAKQRLKKEPEQQITTIGFEVGFNSIASFNRVFKESTGMSPTEFRSGAAQLKGK